MKTKQDKKRNSRWLHHYKFVMYDQDDRRPKFAFKINFINVMLLFALFSVIVIIATLLMLKYSPLKSYFLPEPPAVKESQYKKQILGLQEQIEKLENKIVSSEIYINEVKKVVSGQIKAAEVDTALMAKEYPYSIDDDKLKPSKEDSIFRQEIAKEELDAMSQKTGSSDANLLYTPLKGVVTAGYDVTENHLAIDVAAPEGDAVKAVADGNIVFSDWTPDTGYVVMISHPKNMISVYKHNSAVYKKVGETVKKGEAVAAVGNTGELTTGPHLHFELWINGNAVDPATYIDF